MQYILEMEDITSGPPQTKPVYEFQAQTKRFHMCHDV